MHRLINSKTMEIVRDFKCKNEAEKFLFFYDSIETPHHLEYVNV